jgi:glutamate-1-semialdehyde 2,1-aminomutase
MAIKGMVERVAEEYKRTHPGSRKLHEQAVKIFSANGATHGARIFDPFRPYITHAKGSKKWDVDGNEYIDYVMGHGSLIHGHSHPVMVQALQEQVARGFHYGENQQLEVEWAELIRKCMPMAERIEFCACGNEANMMAIRLARIFTGRRKILRFEENFHGWADEVAPPGSAGVVTPEVTILPMNDLKKVEEELASKEYAIIMTEGGGGHMAGQIPWDTEFIRALSSLTKKYDTIWLIDEVVTGFRDAPGSWQALMGVTPDLTTLGKCISGGLAVGAVVGRSDVFEAFNPKAPVEQRIRHTGTWNANPLLSSAGVAACTLSLNGEPQKKATELGIYLREQGNEILQKRKINGRLYSRSIVHLYLGPFDYEPSDPNAPPTKDVQKIVNPAMATVKNKLCLHLLQRGIATMGGRFFVLSAAHTKDDIDRTIEAFSDSLDAMIAEEEIPIMDRT